MPGKKIYQADGEKKAAANKRRREARAAEDDRARDARRAINAERERERIARMTEADRDKSRSENAERKRERIARMTEADRDRSRSEHAERERERIVQLNDHQREVYRSGQADRVRERRALSRQTSLRLSHGLGLRNHADVLETSIPEHSCGTFDCICKHCKSFNFPDEEKRSGEYNCCHKGRVCLALHKYPDRFKNLLAQTDPKSKNFLENIRKFNSALSCASMGAQISLPPGYGPYCFRIHGQVYHNSGPLHPTEGETPKFAQIYILDPDEAANQRMTILANSGCDHELMRYLSEFMSQHNPYAKAYKMMFEVEQEEKDRALAEGRPPREISMSLITDRVNDQRRYNAPRQNEVAIVFQSGDGAPPFNRDFRVKSRSENKFERISILHSGIDPMTYPLLIPYGEAGWTYDMWQSGNGRKLTQLMYYSYFLAEREEFNPLFYAGKLSQQYIVDAYCKIEANRLHYIEQHQKDLRAENYTALTDYMANRADNLGLKVGKKVVLPSSFGGSPRAMSMHYQDAMAIIRKFGRPDLFLTMTCNPKWEEITSSLKDGHRAEFRPDLIARVFKLKLNELIDDITKKDILGSCIAHVYVIEFQKRGLPHAHMLIVLKSEDKPRTADLVDKVVSAEIPDPDTHPRLHACVLKHMIHGPCGSANTSSPCMADGKCTKEYPKAYQTDTNPNINGYPLYKRTDTGKAYAVGKHQVNNRWVVPYNPYLLLKYNCHINVEICASIKSVKYLFKYVYKGHDCANIEIRHKDGEGALEHNEVKQFLDSRYVSAPEAVWRIFSFDMHKQSHSVEKLPVHLPNEQILYFQDGDEMDALEERDDRLTAWFKLNHEDESARQYLYPEIPEHFTYIANSKALGKKRFWKKRQGFGPTQGKIGRMYTVSVRQGELYYLRLLLHVKGATSFEAMRTVDEEVYATFKEAAAARNLLADDTEWDNMLEETAGFKMPYQIRQLFAFICIFCDPKNALTLWEKHKESMVEDFKHRGLDESQAEYQALYDIQDTMVMHGKKLQDYALPVPPPTVRRLSLEDDIDYEASRIKAAELYKMVSKNPDQKEAVDLIMRAINDDNFLHRLFFLDGPGGSGKTFTYKTLYHLVTGLHLNIKCCASTGIAGTLLPFGSTYHSTFKLPVPLLENSTSSIRPNSQAGKLLRDIKIILWDEVTMTPHYALKAVDILLQDLMNNKKPFGGKVILLGGDFRQCLPVVKKGNRVKIVQSCLKMGNLWHLFRPIKLSKNMRLVPGQAEHQEWLLKLGDGKLSNNADLGEDVIEIPTSFIEHGNLVDSVFGKSIKVKDVKKYADRGILCPKNEDVNKLNTEILSRLEGTERSYLSVDSIITDNEEDVANYPLELLHSFTPSGMPPHDLRLKAGAIIMLLRNLNSKRGLCNGTRLIVKSMHTNFITAEVITGKAAGETVFIPRIDLSPSESDLPVQLKRRQFPIMLAFAMTINKSQGQSLAQVGIYLPDPVFSHGQLYVAFSRGRDKDKIKVKVFNTITQGRLIKGSDRVFTRNCVYREIFDMDQHHENKNAPNSDHRHVDEMEVDPNEWEDMEMDWEQGFEEDEWPEPIQVDRENIGTVAVQGPSTTRGGARFSPPPQQGKNYIECSHSDYDSD